MQCSYISSDSDVISTKTHSSYNVCKSNCTIVQARRGDNVKDGKWCKSESDYMTMFTKAGSRMARVKTRTRMEMPVEFCSKLENRKKPNLV